MTNDLAALSELDHDAQHGEGYVYRMQCEAYLSRALVNAYRAGDLVLIDREGMRSELSALFTSHHRDACYPDAYDFQADIFADAAIAAILGEKS